MPLSGRCRRQRQQPPDMHARLENGLGWRWADGRLAVQCRAWSASGRLRGGQAACLGWFGPGMPVVDLSPCSLCKAGTIPSECCILKLPYIMNSKMVGHSLPCSIWQAAAHPGLPLKCTAALLMPQTSPCPQRHQPPGAASGIAARHMTACTACFRQVWDVRSMAVRGTVEAAHSSPVRDVDLSRHHQHLAVSGGDDGRVFMWDLRCGPGWACNGPWNGTAAAPCSGFFCCISCWRELDL